MSPYRLLCRRAFDFRDDPRDEEKLVARDAARWAARFMHDALADSVR